MNGGLVFDCLCGDVFREDKYPEPYRYDTYRDVVNAHRERCPAMQRRPNACACGDCYHPAFGPDTDGEPCDWCQDCGCSSSDHTLAAGLFDANIPRSVRPAADETPTPSVYSSAANQLATRLLNGFVARVSRGLS